MAEQRALAALSVGSAPPPPDLERSATAKRQRRGADATADVMLLAGTLGLLGPLGGLPRDPGAPPESALLARLRASLQRRVEQAHDVPRLRTALGWFQRFLAVDPGRVPFVPSADDVRGQMYNAETLELFAEFIRTSVPLGRTRGAAVSADAISGYVSAIRMLRSRQARYQIVPPSMREVCSLAITSMRKEDGPRGERARSVGVRADTLRAAAPSFDRASVAGAVDWAAAVFAHNALLRGGEVGVPDNNDPDLARIITWASFDWQRPRPDSFGRPWLIVRVVPIKDPRGSKGAYPTPVARRHDGAFGADPLCPYDALALAWWLRAGPPGAPFPVDAAGRPSLDWQLQARPRRRDFPFFAEPSGAVFTTARVRDLARRIAVAGGLDPAVARTDIGAKAFRIGGGTDWRAMLGEAGARVVRQRGRWDSDIANIYQRPMLADQLAGAAAVGGATGTDLEALCFGFAQRAVR